jgi:DNA-binding response OmpR family regulator
LLARIKTVLRRVQTSLPEVSAVLRVGGLTLKPDRHEALWREDLLPLSTLEFDLLHALMRHPGQVLSREQLLSQVWGYEYHGDSRTVDTAVKRLRAKLRAAHDEAAEMLVTVRGVGYKLSDDE